MKKILLMVCVIGVTALLFTRVASATTLFISGGGTGASSFGTGQFLYYGGSGTALSGTTSPMAGFFTATSTTATSTFPIVNASSRFLGAGLSGCSGGTNALTWNSSTWQFGCNTITPGTGTLTQLTIGAGLNGGVITSTGSISLDYASSSIFTGASTTYTQNINFNRASTTQLTISGTSWLGTPGAIVLTNGTGLPVSTGLTGLGTGVATALAVNVGTAGAFVVNGGALGTPSSGTLTNATGLPVAGISNLGTGVGTFLITPSSANLAAAITDETGTGAAVFGTLPTLASFLSTGSSTITSGLFSANGGASTTNFTVSSGTFLNTLNVTGNTVLANATSTNSFSTTASSTNLFGQTASFGTLQLPSKGIAAGQIAAFDPNGFLIGTTSSTGVTAVNGTANQITSSGGSTPTLTLPSLVIFPTAASTTRLSVFDKAFFGGSATSSFDSTGALLLASALTYGGVTLSNAVTGTGNMVLSAGPTFTGGLTMANGTSTNFFATTASSTNLFSAAASFGALTFPSIKNAVLGTDSNGAVAATTSIGFNYVKGPASSIFGFDSSGVATATTSIGTNYISGVFGVTKGGTGLSSVAQGDILYGSASNVLSALAKDTNSTRYLSNTGGSNNPAWAQIALSTGVSGTLPILNGGTATTTKGNTNGVWYNDGTTFTNSINFTYVDAGKLVTFTNASSTNFTCGTSCGIVSGSSNAPTTNGYIAQDTTNDQLVIGDGSITSVHDPRRFLALGASSSAAFVGTSTITIPMTTGMTLNSMQCLTDAGTLNIQVSYGQPATNLVMVQASTTMGTFTWTSNNTPGAATTTRVQYGTASSAASFGCTISAKVTGT